MNAKPQVIDNGTTVTVRVPISIRRRGGRKLVLAPDGVNLTGARIHRRVDSPMLKATARAFRWREMLETGEHMTIRDIANAERINDSYVSRVLRLTLLAPDIVEAIVAGRHPANLTLGKLTKPFAVEWRAQRSVLT